MVMDDEAHFNMDEHDSSKGNRFAFKNTNNIPDYFKYCERSKLILNL